MTILFNIKTRVHQRSQLPYQRHGTDRGPKSWTGILTPPPPGKFLRSTRHSALVRRRVVPKSYGLARRREEIVERKICVWGSIEVVRDETGLLPLDFFLSPPLPVKSAIRYGVTHTPRTRTRSAHITTRGTRAGTHTRVHIYGSACLPGFCL